MARNLFEAFARAGQTGLGVAANNVIPMHQYNQRMARDEEEHASMENWRQQQLAMQQQNAERDASTQRIGDYYGMMKEYLRNQQPSTPNYPSNYEAAHIQALESGNQSLADYYGGRVMERNSYQDRPPKEVAPKMPTNYVQKFTNRMADLQNNYDYRKAQNFSPNPPPVGENIFRGEFEGQAMSEGLNTDSIRTLIGLPPSARRPMGNVQTSPGAVQMPPPDWPGTGEEWMDYLNRKRGQ